MKILKPDWHVLGVVLMGIGGSQLGYLLVDDQPSLLGAVLTIIAGLILVIVAAASRSKR